MQLMLGLLLTLFGGATLALATWLALIGHPSAEGLTSTTIVFGGGIALIFSAMVKGRSPGVVVRARHSVNPAAAPSAAGTRSAPLARRPSGTR
jgi:hypothetical protein